MVTLGELVLVVESYDATTRSCSCYRGLGPHSKRPGTVIGLLQSRLLLLDRLPLHVWSAVDFGYVRCVEYLSGPDSPHADKACQTSCGIHTTLGSLYSTLNYST